ncbi:MAG: glycosyl hydrolase family 5, partial [Candidatus Omnitrophota bacterium]
MSLRIKNGKIVDETGEPVHLKGINLGGWLMMEGYMLFGKNIPAQAFKQGMREAWGSEVLDSFLKEFR